MGTDAYAYCAVLTRDQWAWEFLRRKPDYRSDYRRFITLWHALEADYGAPPHCDFSKWKRDPRAYGPLPGDVERGAPSGELCVGKTIACCSNAGWARNGDSTNSRSTPSAARRLVPTNCRGVRRRSLRRTLTKPVGWTSASIFRCRCRRNWKRPNSASSAAPPNCAGRASPRRRRWRISAHAGYACCRCWTVIARRKGILTACCAKRRQ